jgi:chaperonin cofactor prefoldin
MKTPSVALARRAAQLARDKKETLDIRLKSLQKQEMRLKEKMKESQEKFEEILKGQQDESMAE